VKFRIEGLVAAAFTPMHGDGTLRLELTEPIVDHLVEQGIRGLYVCGSTGEGPLLTTEERKATAAAYVQAAAGRLPVIVQVGHSSLREARTLAAHAQAIGADAVSAVAPYYFKPDSVRTLIDCMAEITSAAPQLPFYYYHIPALSGVGVDVLEFLREGGRRLPTLVGVKYTAPTVFEFQACVEFDVGRFDVLFGCDEMLLAALAVGARGAVGTTYNLAPALYGKIIDRFEAGDLAEARRCQALAVEMVRIMVRYRGQPAFKAAMKLFGLDCGPNRLPLRSLQPDEWEKLRTELAAIGFLDWATSGGTRNENGNMG